MVSEDLMEEGAESPAKVLYLLRLAAREIHFLAQRAVCPSWEALRILDQITWCLMWTVSDVFALQVCAEPTSAGI